MSPGILFLDEPTTGLDTTTAESVIQILHKSVTKLNQALCISILVFNAIIILLTFPGLKFMYVSWRELLEPLNCGVSSSNNVFSNKTFMV